MELYQYITSLEDEELLSFVFEVIKITCGVLGGIIIIFQFWLRNKLNKINILVHWDKRYMEIYQPITQDHIDLIKKCPKAYSEKGIENFKKVCKDKEGDDVLKEFIYYYRVYMHMVNCCDISKLALFGLTWGLGDYTKAHKKWLKELLSNPKFLAIHEAENKYYPSFCKFTKKVGNT